MSAMICDTEADGPNDLGISHSPRNQLVCERADTWHSLCHCRQLRVVSGGLRQDSVVRLERHKLGRE